jgi:hypothetical protein
MNKRRYILTACMMLLLAMLACNRTTPTPTPQVETPSLTSDGTPGIPTDTPSSDLTPSATEGTPTSVTATPLEGTPECVYDVDFDSDVTIPDDTELAPGTDFVKTWRVRNSGTCAWESGTAWVFESGDKMSGPDSVGAPSTAAGDTADISVHLTAPVTPATYTGYWRMHRPAGEPFGTPIYVRIVVTAGAGTQTPAASASATATSQPGVGPTISYFHADVQEADPGDTITLAWKAEDATSATLYHLMPTGQLGSFWEVNVSGNFTYEIDLTERNNTGFVLFAGDDQGHIVQKTMFVSLRCPDTWFFTPAPDSCPAGPAVFSAAAEEHFEGGTMIWIEEQNLIYVLFDDGNSPQWSVFSDEWDEGEPENDPSLTPPPDFYQPVRGFGLIWRQQASVRDRLGWAVDSEIGFSSAVQRTSRPKYNDTYVRALDGKVWKLLPMSSGWEKIP